MATWQMRPPKNDLPMSEYDDVIILNLTTDVTLQDSFGREEPSMEGDIVLKPRQGTKRKKFTAKHWFGDWDKEGEDWVKEIERLKVHYPSSRAADGSYVDHPVWAAIKAHKLVVKGYTDSKNYQGSVQKKFEDLKPTFNIDDPDQALVASIMNDRGMGKRGEVFDLDVKAEEELKNEVLKDNPEAENTSVTKLKKK
jgi:hypothetical protein